MINEKQRANINNFFSSWAQLNKFKSAYELEVMGEPYYGFEDERVQAYWNILNGHEKAIIFRRYSVHSEIEFSNLFKF